MNGETTWPRNGNAPGSTADSPTRTKLRIFALYEDFASGIPARWLAGEIALHGKSRCDSSIEMWKFDHVTRTGAFQKMTAQEAGAADVLIIAAVSVNEVPAGLDDWLRQVAAWKQNRLSPGLVMGLLGIQNESNVERSLLVNDLARFAAHSKMTFDWRPMDVYGQADAKWTAIPVEQFLADRIAAAFPTPLGPP